jgi:Phage related hypothetical protein (DUF1799)
MQGGPDAQHQAAALAAMGLRLEGQEDTRFAVLPCVDRPVQVFMAVRTQWHMGPRGAVGLHYPAAMKVMDRVFEVPAAEFAATFRDVQLCELGALAWLDEQRTEA